MVRRVLAAVAAALLCAAPLSAGAADAPRPLRTLTFAVDVTIVDALDTPGGAMPGGARPIVAVRGRSMGQRPASGSGERHAGVTIAVKGSIVVDVIHATDDAGLVLDIAEDATKRARPKVRIAVAADGTLLYDPAQSDMLSEEELALVHWLGRGFYGEHPTDVGTAWTVDQSAAGRVNVERYRVVSKEAQRVTLEYALEQHGTVGSYSGSRAGSLVYDTALVVPLKAEFEGITRRQLVEGFATLRSTVKLALTSDSFARR